MKWITYLYFTLACYREQTKRKYTSVTVTISSTLKTWKDMPKKIPYTNACMCIDFSGFSNWASFAIIPLKEVSCHFDMFLPNL